MSAQKGKKGIQSSLKNNPIAIIGMASIYAQAANLRQYWDNIVQKKNCITDIPPSRWSIEDYYDPDPLAPDKTHCKRGGFIPDIDFDPMEFGIPPKVMEKTDSVQLLSLLVAKALLQDAGYADAGKEIRDRIGVVLGAGSMTMIAPMVNRLQYPVWDKVLKSHGLSDEERQSIIETIKLAYTGWDENSFPGLINNIAAGRIANRFDLGGINCITDAACASSFSAIKMAISELIEHRSDMMITGGVDLNTIPLAFLCFSKTPILTPGQDTRPFDHASDGALLGEGIGMIMLKLLEDAERDGDRIYAVIRGIGSSSDGKFRSIYAPRLEGQVKALRRAYQDADLPPSSVDLVEAHGTGTAAGDLREFLALKEVFSDGNLEKNSIALGTVKSQIGHTKVAAGSASLIKAALALYHKILPPMINISEPNPKLDIQNSPFYLITEPKPWIRADSDPPRRAGVSAFGFGGSNFHVVLEEYAPEHNGPYRLQSVPREVILAAPSNGKLGEKCEKKLEWLRTEAGERNFCEIVNSLAAEKIPPDFARIGFLASSVDHACEMLESSIGMLKKHGAAEEWADQSKGIYFRKKAFNPQGKVVVLFPGQGSQYLNMGMELTCNFPALRQLFAEMDSLCKNDDTEPLSDLVFPPTSFTKDGLKARSEILQRTENAQPAIGVLNAGMFRILEQAGLKPDFLAGHSFGELTALWASGALGEKDYLKLARARGKAMAASNSPGSESGAMLAVNGRVEVISEAIKNIPSLSFANYNSNEQVVLTGAKESIQQAQERLKKEGLRNVLLPVSAAFHSSFVSHAARPFAKALKSASIVSPKIPVYSNTMAEPYPAVPQSIRKRLGEQILKPVLFKQEIENIYAAGGSIFIECGPRSVLTGLVDNILADKPHYSVALNPSAKLNSDLQFRRAFLQLRVAGLKLKNTDPYSIQPEVVEKKDKRKLTIPINASNYLSKETRDAFENALKNNCKINSPANRKKEVTMASGIDHNNPSDSGSQPGNIDENAQSAERSTGCSPPTKQAAHYQEMMASLERNMMQFHQLQAETLRVHEQYLKNQAEYSRMFYRLLQDQYRLLIDGKPPERTQQLPDSQEILSEPDNDSQDFEQAVSAKPSSETPADLVETEEIAPEISESIPETSAPEVESALSLEDLQKTMLQVVSEKTGYPVEMLETDMDIEADLGIDSIKRVEILAAFQDRYPDMPSFQMEELAELRTLKQIVEFIESQHTSLKKKEPETASPELKKPKGIKRSTAGLKKLPEPDFLEFNPPAGQICLIVNDGTSLTDTLARALVESLWKPVVLSLPPSLIEKPYPVSESVPEVAVEELSENHLREKLAFVTEKYGQVGTFIHLNPSDSKEPGSGIFQDKEKKIMECVFLLAGQLKDSLLQASENGQGCFMTVIRLDGELGFGQTGEFGAVAGGLPGMVKTLSREWDNVFCRAVDLSPELDAEDAARHIIAELHDPDIQLVEVGYSSRGRFTPTAQSQ